MTRKIFILIILAQLIISGSFCQNIDMVGKQKAIRINGGIGINYSSTLTNDSNRVAMPNFWSLNMNLNVDIYGLAIPFTAVLTNGKFNMNNSFSQFGVSPKYKWITLHAGYRQFAYSSFTVSGQTFLGGGIEIHPGILRMGFFTGLLHKAVKWDTTQQFQQTIPGSYPLNVNTVNGTNYYSPQASFERKAWGAKLGFGRETNYVDFIIFKGQDNSSSLSDINSKTNLIPEENLVLGINVYQRIGKHISFGFNSAASIYTYNSTSDDITDQINKDIPLKNYLDKLIPIRATTQFQWAGDVNLGFNFSNFSLQSEYKHIEPYFKSMGLTSGLSDLELISIQPSWSLFHQKIRFTNMFQYQNDNINHYKQLTTDRMMINSSVSINLSNRWGIDLSFNNYDMKQQKLLAIVPDSIQAHQLSYTYTIAPRYIFTNTIFTDVISLIGSYTNMDGGIQTNGNINSIQNYYATLNNSLAVAKGGWNINSGLNYNSSKTTINDLKSYGFIAGVSKSLFNNKLGLSNNNTLLWNTLNGKATGNTYSVDMTGTFFFLRNQNISFGANYLFSPANGVYNNTNFHQTRLTISYQYNF